MGRTEVAPEEISLAACWQRGWRGGDSRGKPSSRLGSEPPAGCGNRSGSASSGKGQHLRPQTSCFQQAERNPGGTRAKGSGGKWRWGRTGAQRGEVSIVLISLPLSPLFWPRPPPFPVMPDSPLLFRGPLFCVPGAWNEAHTLRFPQSYVIKMLIVPALPGTC